MIVARDVAYSDVIGHWSLVIGGGASALHCAGLKSHLQKYALQNNAPKLLTSHHSPFTIRKQSFRFGSSLLTPHSSLDFHRKEFR